MEGESCTLHNASIQEERLKSGATKHKKRIIHKTKKKCGTNKIMCSVTAKRNLMQVAYVQLRLIG